MIALNFIAKQWAHELEEAAHVSTAGIKVRIIHPRFRFSQPHYRNGTIRLPSCIFGGGFDWTRTWRHELQHAHDDIIGLLPNLTSKEAEERARAAEQTFQIGRHRVGLRS